LIPAAKAAFAHRLEPPIFRSTMKHQNAPRTVGSVVVALAALALPALGATSPWTLYRTIQPNPAESTSVHAVLLQSPWDDSPGVLSDGNSYFYMLSDANGQSVPLSVDKNPVLDTVRLGFDDGNPTSAPVDSHNSSVSVDPASIPADGLSSSWVTVVPRDSNGVNLGAGLALTIDAVALWPGKFVGSFVDLNNGIYIGRVVSTLPGQGTVWVDVEGTQLDDEPTIDFQSVGPLSLRDQAMLELDALTSPGGSFDQLLGDLDPSSDPGAANVVKAKSEALASLGTLLLGDPQSDDDAIKDLLRFSALDLTKVLTDPGQVDTDAVNALLEDVAEIARLVAQYWYEVAVADCAGQNPGSRLDQAEMAIVNGDAAVANGDWVGAGTLYAKSIEKSQFAMAFCN
jgi:invasin-like protein